PRRETPARHLLGLALWLCFACCAIYMLLLFLTPIGVRQSVGVDALGGWLFVVPIMLFLAGARQALGYWANRSAKFETLAKAQWSQALLAAAVSVGLGALGVGFAGLLLGAIAGTLGATLFLVYVFRTDLTRSTLRWSLSKLVLARRFKDYPLYSAS